MLRNLSVFFIGLLISCGKYARDNVAYSLEDRGDKILICIDSIKVNWSKEKSEIIKDSLYNETISSKKKKDFIFLARLITDISTSDISYCKTNKRLKKGDLAFILIDKVYGLPYYQITGMQCDYFENGCPYPVGLFEAINKDRNKTRDNVLKYLDDVKW